QLDLVNTIGNFLDTAGQWTDVLEIRRFYFRNLRQILGAEHPDILTSMGNLATVLRVQGKYKEAEEMHRQALGLRERVLGKEHPDILVSVNNRECAGGNRGVDGGGGDMPEQVRALGDGAGQGASRHTDEHEQPGSCAGRSGQVRAGGRDVSTSIRAEGDG